MNPNKYYLGWVLIVLISKFSFAQTVPNTGVDITWPVKRAIFQRNTSNQAIVSLAAQASRSPSKKIQFRIRKLDLKTEAPMNYVFGSSINWLDYDANGEITSNVPNKFKAVKREITLDAGWYQLETRTRKNLFGGACETAPKVIFGVGDVYMIAGQSNASGFATGIGDDGIENTYNNTYTMPKAVSVINSNVNLDDPIKGAKSELIPFVNGFKSLDKESVIFPTGVSSWLWAPLANKIVNGSSVPVSFYNVAYPDQSVDDWKISGNNYKSLRHISQTFGNTFGMRSVLWMQGEKDVSTNYEYQFGHVTENIEWTTRPISNSNVNDYSEKLKSTINTLKTDLRDINSAIQWTIAMVSISSFRNYPQAIPNRCELYQTIKESPNALGPWKNYENIVTEQIEAQSQTVSKLGPNIDSVTSRNDCQNVHLSGASLETAAQVWYNNNPSSTSPVNSKKVLKMVVTPDNSGSNYVLTIPTAQNTLNLNTFRWVKSTSNVTGGVYQNQLAPVSNNTSNSITLPQSASSKDYYVCYASENTNVDENNGHNVLWYVSQPFISTPDLYTSFYVSPSTLELGSGQNTSNSFQVNATNIEWDASENNSWFDINTEDDLSGGGGISTINVVATQANTSTSARTGTVNFTLSNGSTQTINITQAAASPSGCTSVSLTSGAFSPSNPQSEWSGNGASMQLNKTIQGATLQVNGQQFATGIGVHSNSRIVYNINNAYSTFSGLVGRDDEQDACGCGTQRVQFQIKGNGTVIWTSNPLDHQSPAQPFSVSVAGISTLELIMNDGGDNAWGDHGDWLSPSFNCPNGGGGPACSVQTPSVPTASSTNVTAGTNVTLTTSCASGTPKWSNNATTVSTTVTPSATTNYTVYCENGANCSSATQSITITVTNSGTCSALYDGLVMGSWNVTGNQLVARQFHNGQYWLTQRVTTSPDRFVVRGSEMLLRGDVSLANSSYSSLVGCFAFQYSAYGGLLGPTAAQFPTPAGYSLVYASDGTPNFLQNSPSSPAAYNGYFDTANCGGLTGWVWNSAAPGVRPVVEIMEGSNVMITGTANGYRADLQAAGIGDGYYTFNITTPSSLRSGAARTIWARVQGSDYQLNNSPKTLNCPAASGSRIGVMETVTPEEKLEGMLVSPNPSDGLFSVSCSAKKGERISLLVLNMSGVVVLKQDFMADDDVMHHVFSIKNQPNGPYIINLRTGSTNYNQRIVKIE